MKYAEEHIDDYRHFVVWYPTGKLNELKIESGWEYREDAHEHLDEINDTLFYAEKNKDGALDIKVLILTRHNRIKRIHDDDNWEGIPW